MDTGSRKIRRDFQSQIPWEALSDEQGVELCLVWPVVRSDFVEADRAQQLTYLRVQPLTSANATPGFHLDVQHLHARKDGARSFDDLVGFPFHIEPECDARVRREARSEEAVEPDGRYARPCKHFGSMHALVQRAHSTPMDARRVAFRYREEICFTVLIAGSESHQLDAGFVQRRIRAHGGEVSGMCLERVDLRGGRGFAKSQGIGAVEGAYITHCIDAQRGEQSCEQGARVDDHAAPVVVGRSTLAQNDQEVVSHRPQQWPTGDPAFDAPERSMAARIASGELIEVGWRDEHAQASQMRELEVPFEVSIELSGCEVPRPDGVPVHSDGHGVPGEANADSCPTAAQGVVSDLPWTDATDDGEHERAAGPEQAGAFAGNLFQVRHAIEGAEVGVGSVVAVRAFEPMQLLRAQMKSFDSVLDIFSRCPAAGAFDHARRPVYRRYRVPMARHARCVEPSAASNIDERTAGCECGVQPPPHFGAHALNAGVVASRPVVVRGNAVECILGVAQMRGYLAEFHACPREAG